MANKKASSFSLKEAQSLVNVRNRNNDGVPVTEWLQHLRDNDSVHSAAELLPAFRELISSLPGPVLSKFANGQYWWRCSGCNYRLCQAIDSSGKPTLPDNTAILHNCGKDTFLRLETLKGVSAVDADGACRLCKRPACVQGSEQMGHACKSVLGIDYWIDFSRLFGRDAPQFDAADVFKKDKRRVVVLAPHPYYFGNREQFGKERAIQATHVWVQNSPMLAQGGLQETGVIALHPMLPRMSDASDEPVVRSMACSAAEGGAGWMAKAMKPVLGTKGLVLPYGGHVLTKSEERDYRAADRAYDRDASTSSSSVPAKRKRGRPPKNAPAEPSTTASTTASTSYLSTMTLKDRDGVHDPIVLNPTNTSAVGVLVNGAHGKACNMDCVAHKCYEMGAEVLPRNATDRQLKGLPMSVWLEVIKDIMPGDELLYDYKAMDTRGDPTLKCCCSHTPEHYFFSKNGDIEYTNRQ